MAEREAAAVGGIAAPVPAGGSGIGAAAASFAAGIVSGKAKRHFFGDLWSLDTV